MKEIKKGMLLVSEPFLGDPEFERAVVFIVEKNESGTLGFVLNNELDVKVNDVLPEMPFINILFKGGPVCIDSLFFIFKSSENNDNFLPVIDDYYWGGNIEELSEKILYGNVDLDSVRFFIGYSGWSPGQLEMEMKHKVWEIVSFDLDKIFSKKPENIWKMIMKSMGGEYAIYADSPIDPQLN
ncbi:MAG: YqgE/AlgH family protein [Bacteroidetes bacterium]|nr:YqgE/AlgH family protein [Bacteroidota bacterium]